MNNDGGSICLTPQPPFRGPICHRTHSQTVPTHISANNEPDYYDFRFVSEVLDDAESFADTFEVIRRGYHRLPVIFNAKPVTLASSGNVHHQSRGF